MNIVIITKNLNRNLALENFIEKKFNSLKKFLDSSQEVTVEAERETKHHKKGEIFLVKAQVILSGKSLMAEARGSDLFVAINKAKEELKKEIEKYKVKKIDKNRRQARKSKESMKI